MPRRGVTVTTVAWTPSLERAPCNAPLDGHPVAPTYFFVVPECAGAHATSKELGQSRCHCFTAN